MTYCINASIRTVTMLVAGLFLFVTPSVAQITWPQGQVLPSFPAPAQVQDLITMNNATVTGPNAKAEYYLFASLRGLVNRKQPRIFAYEGDALGEGPYIWMESLGLSWIEQADRWQLITKYKSEISGLIVYDPAQDHTVNLAGVIAKERKALIVSPDLLSRLTSAPYNFPVLVDMRGQFTSKLQIYQRLFDTYWPSIDKRMLISLSPEFHQSALREYAIAMGAATIWLDPIVSGESELLNRFLASMPAGANILGWWPEEGAGITRGSEYGIPTIPSDYCTNLTLHSGMPRTINIKPIPPKPALQNKIYVAFIISDGDNLQFVEHGVRKLWSNPDRGSVPIGWTVSPSMVDAMPGALNYFHETATANDNLISGPSGYGYAYPNFISDQNKLINYITKTEEYSRKAGIRVTTIWNTITGGINQNVGEMYAKYAPSILGLTGQNTGGPLSIYSNSLPGKPLSCNYCWDEGNITSHIVGGSAGWNRNEPRFLIIQVQPWRGITCTNFKNVANSLNSDYVVVRPDHLFQLQREAKGLPIDPIGTSTVGLVTAYKDCNYAGLSSGLEAGDYNLAKLRSVGVLDNDISSLKIKQGYKVILFDGDNFSGASTELVSDMACSVDWDNRVTSLRVVTNGITNLAGTYYLNNRNSGLNMDVTGGIGAVNDGARIQQWNVATTANQQFRFDHLGDGTYKITALHSDKVLDIDAIKKENGAYAQQWTYFGSFNQQFIVVGTDLPGCYKLIAKHSGKVIEVVGASTAIEAKVHQWENNNQTNGQWKFVPVVTTGNITAPSSLVAKNFSNSQINLTWKDNSTNETGFAIELKLGINGTYTQVAQLPAGANAHSLTGLNTLSTYFIRVRALNASTVSNYSNEAIAATTAASWTKGSNPIWTPWGEGINEVTNVLQEYPRPQLVKENWQNLNGLWDVWEGEDINFKGSKRGILVPFPIQSALSGVKQNWHRFTYEKYIGIPKEWNGKRTILHFEAIDFQAEIFINGQSILLHKGGYDPFSIDITDRVTAGNTYKLNVKVWDPNDTEGFPGPQGKQADDRFGAIPSAISYTPTGGIWQTVWMESVPNVYISDIKIVPNIDNGTLQLTVTTSGNSAGVTFEAVAKDGITAVNTVSGSANATVTLSIPNQKLWSPESPFLYDLIITLKNGSTAVETVQSYFGMRKISLGKFNGTTRMMVNNKFVFQAGPLDQGFWPDGLHTPPSESAILFDLQGMKDLGYNMVRKHIKVEPARWYYNADKLGLLVWQDMVSGQNGTTTQRDQFKLELERMIRTHWNTPSIIMWVPFNEQWGMFDPVPIANFVKNLDPSRLVNENSGCCGAPMSTVGDVKDYHYYSAPSCPSPDDNRALANGEYGGLVLRKPGNMWNDNAWGTWAKVLNTDDEFTSTFVDDCNILKNLRTYRGMSASVFTQWTDVEAEINGNYTYDRKVFKGDRAKIKAALQSTADNNSLNVNPPSGYSVFEGFNIPGLFIRHQDSKGFMGNVIAPLEDAYWKMVPGLAGAGISFQSLNFPNSYLRHADGKLILSVNDGGQQLKADATFYMRPGLSNAALASFESYNFPGRFIRHNNSVLYSDPITDQLGRDDATFFVYSGSTPVGTGDGLTGNYFNGMNFETPVYSKKETTLNFDWAAGSPNAAVNVDMFSARWTGQVQPKYSGEYTFYINSDNGRRLWINNQLVIDKWIDDWSVEYAGKITLTAGQKYDIRVEYFENNGGAGCKLEWSHVSQVREVIPQAQLYSNALPSVSISSPVNSATFTTPISVTINASASDNGGSISKVEFYNGATKLGEDATAPYSYSWTNVAAGTYTLTTRATDNQGGVSVSAAVTVVVNQGTQVNQSPTVSLTSPLNNTSYNAPATISLAANASDGDGNISKVEFYSGSQKLGEDVTSPYTYSWTNVGVGNYTLTARAYDNIGAVATSASVNATVVQVTTDLCSGLPTYVENGGYAAASKVKNAGRRYECKEFPYSGWCNGAAWAYGPGIGAYWGDAWYDRGSCAARAGSEQEANAEKVLLITPNPTTGLLNIQVGESSTVSVYNALGIEVIASQVVEDKGTLDLSNLSYGIYLVKINNGSGLTTQSVLKK
jgi:GxGYxYP putative glycoside hydrolase C-terminal domain/GxGYxY sequence motif in domain of unknown function N-terminal/Alpha-L-arabinofuranosidase B (ABFB) domain/PA14 domain/Bacterial Ig domain/Ricin-type beta-trefoil lectin domain-like/Glycosyl hydrolases family 2/Glycosyl hydrolases family 2, sugar binding domain/Secretion system C-terminal sorting domain/Glycosyl hydrolases family 2, TIM barrel domain